MSVVPTALVRSLRLGLITVLAAGAALLGAAAEPATAVSGDCAPVDVYFNSASPVGLYRYSPLTGSVSSLPLDAVFVDITFSPDGSRLYGLAGSSLAEIDPQTGHTLDTIAIPGLSGNALAQQAGGGLIAASGSRLIDIDLDARTATTDPRSLPDGYYSSGDLLVLPDGDLLVVASQGVLPGGDALVRISPDGTTTVLGTVPYSYGISASGDSLYLTSINGILYRLDDLPTRAGVDALPVVRLRETGTYPYGATSINESKPCNTAFSASVSDDSAPVHEPPDLIAYGYPADTRGTVTFRWEGNELCTAAISRTEPVTRCKSKDLPTGHYLVTATLSGSGAVATTSYDVEGIPTTLVVKADPAKFEVGSTTTLSVRGLPSDATGTVYVQQGEFELCRITLPATSCVARKDLRVGTYNISASFPGDERYDASAAQTSFEVVKKPTDLGVEPEHDAVVQGVANELRASGLPDDATGTVRFSLGDEELCEVTLPDELSCTTSDDLGVGEHSVTATYSGDDRYLGSTATATFTVTSTDDQDPDPSTDPSADPTSTQAAPTSSSRHTEPVSDDHRSVRTSSRLASTGGPRPAVLVVGVLVLLSGAALLLRRRGSRR